jgi:hypothetical protein
LIPGALIAWPKVSAAAAVLEAHLAAPAAALAANSVAARPALSIHLVLDASIGLTVIAIEFLRFPYSYKFASPAYCPALLT